MDEHVSRLAEALTSGAHERIAEDRFGVVGGVITGDGELELFEGPVEGDEDETRTTAFAQVQAWVEESTARAGGIAIRCDPERRGENPHVEVQVEGRDGSTMVFLHPYRRRRMRGWDFTSGRVYTEPDQRYLTFA